MDQREGDIDVTGAGVPRVTASLGDDGAAEVVVNGTPYAVSGTSEPAGRENIVRFIATRVAAQLGHAVRVEIADPAGRWQLLIYPDGSVQVLEVQDWARPAGGNGPSAPSAVGPGDQAGGAQGAAPVGNEAVTGPVRITETAADLRAPISADASMATDPAAAPAPADAPVSAAAAVTPGDAVNEPERAWQGSERSDEVPEATPPAEPVTVEPVGVVEQDRRDESSPAADDSTPDRPDGDGAWIAAQAIPSGSGQPSADRVEAATPASATDVVGSGEAPSDPRDSAETGPPTPENAAAEPVPAHTEVVGAAVSEDTGAANGSSGAPGEFESPAAPAAPGVHDGAAQIDVAHVSAPVPGGPVVGSADEGGPPTLLGSEWDPDPLHISSPVDGPAWSAAPPLTAPATRAAPVWTPPPPLIAPAPINQQRLWPPGPIGPISADPSPLGGPSAPPPPAPGGLVPGVPEPGTSAPPSGWPAATPVPSGVPGPGSYPQPGSFPTPGNGPTASGFPAPPDQFGPAIGTTPPPGTFGDPAAPFSPPPGPFYPPQPGQGGGAPAPAINLQSGPPTAGPPGPHHAAGPRYAPPPTAGPDSVPFAGPAAPVAGGPVPTAGSQGPSGSRFAPTFPAADLPAAPVANPSGQFPMAASPVPDPVAYLSAQQAGGLPQPVQIVPGAGSVSGSPDVSGNSVPHSGIGPGTGHDDDRDGGPIPADRGEPTSADPMWSPASDSGDSSVSTSQYGAAEQPLTLPPIALPPTALPPIAQAWPPPMTPTADAPIPTDPARARGETPGTPESAAHHADDSSFPAPEAQVGTPLTPSVAADSAAAAGQEPAEPPRYHAGPVFTDAATTSAPSTFVSEPYAAPLGALPPSWPPAGSQGQPATPDHRDASSATPDRPAGPGRHSPDRHSPDRRSPEPDVPSQSGGGPGAPARPTEVDPSRLLGPLPTLDSLIAARPPTVEAPAAQGWQVAVRRMTGGLIKPKAGPAEQQHRAAVAAVQRSLSGPRTIVVVNPKGGAHKTTATLLIAATFGMFRGGYTLAWDNNETRGTLGWRAHPARHSNTAVDLLRDLARFEDPRNARVGDLDNYVRGQGDAQFDVLASDEDAASAASIDRTAFIALHRSLSRFYRILVVDTGNNMRASNWQAAVDQADQMVIVSTVREDTAQSAAWLIDALRAAGRHETVRRAVTVLAAPAKDYDRNLGARLHQHFGQLTRTVVDVPHDESLVSGGPLNVAALTPESREAWLQVASAIAEGL